MSGAFPPVYIIAHTPLPSRSLGGAGRLAGKLFANSVFFSIFPTNTTWNRGMNSFQLTRKMSSTSVYQALQVCDRKKVRIIIHIAGHYSLIIARAPAGVDRNGSAFHCRGPLSSDRSVVRADRSADRGPRQWKAYPFKSLLTRTWHSFSEDSISIFHTYTTVIYQIEVHKNNWELPNRTEVRFPLGGSSQPSKTFYRMKIGKLGICPITSCHYLLPCLLRIAPLCSRLQYSQTWLIRPHRSQGYFWAD